MNSRLSFQALIGITLALLLTACGFHLRGSYQLPPALKTLYLATSNPYGEFETALKWGLEASGVTLVKNPGPSDYRLELISVQSGRRVLTVSPRVKVSEYEIEQSVRYRVLNAKGEVVLADRTIKSKRDYTFDPNLVLGKSDEEAILYADIRRDLVRQLIQSLMVLK